MADISKIKLPDGTTHDIHNTKYTFTSGTNSFKVSASDSTGIPQTVIVTPSIANNITGTGTRGYLAKFNSENTITNGVELGESTTTFLRNDGTWATPPSGTDTKNTAGATDTSSKIFLVGALEQSANPQTYSDDHCYVTNGQLQTKSTLAQAGVYANTDASGTAGGLSLYSTNDPSSYGITMRNGSNLGRHGYVQGDWAGYLCFSGDTNRGWIFRAASTNVASVSGLGHAVFNGSVTVGGNTTNTTGCSMQFNSTTQSLDFVFK